jgi:hypothetical protein
MGHRFPAVPRFRGPLGVKRALLALGAQTAADFLDMHFTRLPGAAFAWTGDLVLLPDGPDPESCVLGAVCIADGQGALFGWHEDHPEGLSAIKFAESHAMGAWRL